MKEPTSHISYNEKWIPLSEVEYVDIEEDWSGQDLITFRKDGVEYQSFVILK